MEEFGKVESGSETVSAWSDGKVVEIRRGSHRGSVRSATKTYALCTKEGTSFPALTKEKANDILARIRDGMSYDDAFVFAEVEATENIMPKTEMEHRFTSTGIKFWKHVKQMAAFRASIGNTIISTHISPEGSCNLSCDYCSVSHRMNHSRLPLEVIQDYVVKLQSRGLRAVILTGGGEPTAYKQFNELVDWLRNRGLKIALITNGTLSHRVSDETWKAFSWVRASINVFPGWQEKIFVPKDKLSPECVLGFSCIFTSSHGCSASEMLQLISRLADKCGAEYVRVLPNCLLSQDKLLLLHDAIDRELEALGDARFFHQHKLHRSPKAHTCHQAQFRPYLSEEPWDDGEPGTVFPCDSLVLNNASAFFDKEYRICKAGDVLDFLDGKIELKFDPSTKCEGCVFADTVDMLDDFKKGLIDRTAEFERKSINHGDFV